MKHYAPFLLSVLLVTILSSAYISRPVHAESFLYNTTCQVVGLLGIQCQTNPAPPASQPTQPDQPTNQPSNPPSSPANNGTSTPSSTSQPSASSSASRPSSTPFAPLDVPDQTLQPITPVEKSSGDMAVGLMTRPSDSFASVGENNGQEAILGAVTQTPLQPSVEGWKIFGIYWYWLALALAVVAAVWYFLRKSFTHSSKKMKHTTIKL